MPKKDASGRSMSLTSQESYSAVIIADLVAEVPAPEDHTPAPHEGKSSRLNPAFEPPPGTPAVVDVELEEKGAKQQRNGSSDITKGVILNVNSQFAQDRLAPDPTKLRAPSPDRDFRSMSVPRKIAFGFSFLPSIMFVLCFAVILPCKEQLPCVQRVWSNVMEDTEVTSKLWVSNERLAFTFMTPSSGVGSVSSLDSKSGDRVWTQVLQSPSPFIDCGKLSEQDACLVAENSAKISLFNLSDGASLWRRDLEDDDATPAAFPAVLPDCGDGENVSRVAMGLSRAQIKVLALGTVLKTFNISGCESVPFLLTPWIMENSTDLLFACRQGDKESFMKLSQSQWCPSKKKTKENVITMHTTSKNDLEKSFILPTEDGLLLWTKEEILMIDNDGQKLWSTSSKPHSDTNRFVLFGKFNTTGSQVALFSSSLQGNLTVSTYDASSGDLAWLKQEPNSEVSDVALIHGKDKDFAVVSIQKVSSGTLASEALNTIGSMSSTLASVLTQEEVSAPEDTPSVTSEISFLDFSDDFVKPVHKMTEGGVTSIKVDPSYTTDSETISIYVLRNPEEGSKDKTSQLDRIDVSLWDITQNKESSCKWKE